MPRTKHLELAPGAVDDATAFLRHGPDSRGRLDRVADLVDGFESPFGLELLSTVHWVATQENTTTLEATIAHTYAWNSRKKQFTERQILIAYDLLSEKGWLGAPKGEVRA